MAEKAEGGGAKFGPLQGLWLMLGYVGTQFLGSALVYLLWGIGIGFWMAMHPASHAHMPRPGSGVLAWALVAGFTLSAAWAVFYVLRSARPLLRRGEATGIGWCEPRKLNSAWLAAAAVGIGALAFAMALAFALPPDPEKLTGPMSKLFMTPGWPRVTVTLIAVCGAPFVEEFVFRGAFLAALASRWSLPVAGGISTLVFVALHAADKIGWWPGFLAVGMLGALLVVLRVRYRSVWPGVAAHFLYNCALLLAP